MFPRTIRYGDVNIKATGSVGQVVGTLLQLNISICHQTTGKITQKSSRTAKDNTGIFQRRKRNYALRSFHRKFHRNAKKENTLRKLPSLQRIMARRLVGCNGHRHGQVVGWNSHSSQNLWKHEKRQDNANAKGTNYQWIKQKTKSTIQEWKQHGWPKIKPQENQ